MVITHDREYAVLDTSCDGGVAGLYNTNGHKRLPSTNVYDY